MFILLCSPMSFFFFFFNDTATTEIYTLSLHDALPIYLAHGGELLGQLGVLRSILLADAATRVVAGLLVGALAGDRKSTRLNSSHGYISYAVFCLKKKKKI